MVKGAYFTERQQDRGKSGEVRKSGRNSYHFGKIGKSCLCIGGNLMSNLKQKIVCGWLCIFVFEILWIVETWVGLTGLVIGFNIQ